MPDPSQGVFETLLVRDGRVQALERHVDRLRASVEELYDIALPPGIAATIGRRAGQLTGAHRLRVDAVPSPDGVTIELTTSLIDPRRPRRYGLAPVTVAGGQGRHKWCDRRALGQPSGGAVALLVDADGAVLEAAWANVWILDGTIADGGRLITPPADGRILPGVTRARLLGLAPSLGFDVTERPIALDDARAAPTLLLTSSLALAAGASVGPPPAPGDDTIDALRDALLVGEWS